MTWREPRGGEDEEEELERLGIQKEEVKSEKNILLISDYDEWCGPIYTCPFCAEEKLWDDFNFCPECGGNLEGYGFETLKEGWRKMEKEK